MRKCACVSSQSDKMFLITNPLFASNGSRSTEVGDIHLAQTKPNCRRFEPKTSWLKSLAL